MPNFFVYIMLQKVVYEQVKFLFDINATNIEYKNGMPTPSIKGWDYLFIKNQQGKIYETQS